MKERKLKKNNIKFNKQDCKTALITIIFRGFTSCREHYGETYCLRFHIEFAGPGGCRRYASTAGMGK